MVGAALLAALPACGKKTDETLRAAGITPASALGFLSVSLDPSIEQKRNMIGLAKRFPEAEVKDDFDETKNELLADILAEADLDYEEDVKPWLGSELALAVLPGTNAPQPLIAVLIEQDDADAARAAMEKASKKAEAEGDGPITFEIVDDFVIATQDDDPAVAKQTVEAFVAQSKKDEGDLSSSREFTEVVDELHGDRLILGWFDTKDAIAEMGRVMEVADFPLEGIMKYAVPTAFDLHAAKSAAVLEFVARTTSEAKTGKPSLTDGLPANSFGVMTVFDIGTIAREALGALGGTQGDILAIIREETGLDLDADLLSWMGGEAVLVAAPGSGSPIPQFALVVEPTDRAAAEAAIPKARELLARNAEVTLVERQIAGTTAYVLPRPLEGGVQPAMALFPDRFVVASTPSYLEQVAKKASPSLAESDAYQSVLGEASSDATRFQMVFDIDAIREAFESFLVTDDNRAEYEADIKPNVEPFDAVGMVLRRDGKFDRAELKVTFD
jgi:hypothetical protein